MLIERPLQIDVQRKDDLAIVKMSGSATMNVSQRFSDSLSEAAQHPVRFMVIDMADLDFMCSEGLGAIVAAHVKCAHRGGAVRLAAATGPIQEMLDLTRLSTLFPVYLTVEEAIKA